MTECKCGGNCKCNKQVCQHCWCKTVMVYNGNSTAGVEHKVCCVCRSRLLAPTNISLSDITVTK